MSQSLSDRIEAMAALPNALLPISESDLWLEDSIKQLQEGGFVLAEMIQSIQVNESTSEMPTSLPNKWKVVNLSADKPKKRKLIIKGRK